MRNKVIFIDWDGTLCWSRFWESYSKDNKQFAETISHFFATEKDLIKIWMRGQKTSEEINTIICERSGQPFDNVWLSFQDDCQKMDLDNVFKELIQKIRKEYIVILITGNMDCFSRFTMPALKLNSLFDRVINSSDVGKLKTDNDGEIFKDCLSSLRLSISDSCLIEDSVNTCGVFEKLGGKSRIVKSKDDTITYLKQFLSN
jgi:FMN phosphatase YigB (HAD superfamily)